METPDEDEAFERFVRQAVLDKKKVKLNCLCFPDEPDKSGIYLEADDGERHRLSTYQAFLVVLCLGRSRG